MIKYRRWDDEFYHPEHPVLFNQHDKITSLDDCPFPLETDTFKVILFGEHLTDKDKRFAVVEYTKNCGHKVQERISFQENVKDFEHFGTKFYGYQYSINDWKDRIERFRVSYTPCDVCQIVKHSIWIKKEGLDSPRRSWKNMKKDCLSLLDYNFKNWKEFVDIDKSFEQKELVSI